MKGGLASGASAVAVTVAVAEPAGEAEAGDWAVASPARPQAGRAPVFPVLVDVPTGRVTCPEAPTDLRRLVQDHVVPSLGPG